MKKEKIGICTLYTGYNFGSALQAYSTKMILDEMGFEPELFKVSGSLVRGRDIRLKKTLILFTRMLLFSKNKINVIKSFSGNNKSNVNIKTLNEFDDFYNNKLNPTVISYKKLKKISKNTEYISFICGSDQIWNSTAFYVDPFYYLSFCPKNKRIAYAPSFGRTYIPTYNKNIIKKKLLGIDNISIRENSGKKIIKELINKDVDVCLDPTLLLDKHKWNKSLEVSKINKKYILCYFLNAPSSNAKKFINKLSIEKKMDVISINNNFFKNVVYGGPETFLSFLSSAEYVITDSFHGVAFSINFEKKFYVFDRQYITENQSTRIKSLLEIVNLEDVFECEYELDSNYFDYKMVSNILSKEREKSLEFLKKSIRSCENNEKRKRLN